MEQFHENQTENGLLPLLNHSKSCPTDFQEPDNRIMTTFNVRNITPLSQLQPNIKERLVREKQTNELYLPLTSTVVLKPKKKKCSIYLWISKLAPKFTP